MNLPGRAAFGTFFLACSALAGTTGTLEGVVRDLRTGEILPGVNVLLVEIRSGGVSDGDGAFIIQNIRAGRYDVRVTHVGYRPLLLKGVLINPDLRTRLSIDLEPSDVQLGEIVVVQEQPLIQRDVTATTYIVAAEDIAALPIDNAVEVIRTKAGVTLEGNVRGGKTTEVIYLVDGLPVQDVLAGGLSAQLPNSSIVGMSVYTGGFEAEYGNALSGVVNIVTRSGSDRNRIFLRADRDNPFGVTQSSKTTRFELSASGPVSGAEITYLGALNGILTDTRWWQDMRLFFPGPIDRTFNGFGKIESILSPELRLSVQGLYSDHDWNDYEFNWRYNLDGLPPQRRTSYRLAAILTHTLSGTFFYTASLSRYFLRSRAGSGAQDDVPVNDPYQYDFFLRYIVDGQRAWWTRTTQESYTAKADAAFKVHRDHLLRFGAEMTFYNLHSDLVKLEPRKTYFGKPLVNEPQLNFSSTYGYRPRAGAVYVQTKTDVAQEGVLLTLGLRYDFLDPTAERPRIEAIPQSDTGYTFATLGTVSARWKQQVSPRFGAAMQLTERGYLFINLGWYVQYPLFDYLYTGLDRVALGRGISAITGNPDLEPERSKSLELSFKYALPLDIVGSVTYFRKESTNLIDTKTFVPADSKLAGSFGFAEFVNNPYADARGVEFSVSRPRGEWVTGELSYTYMVAEGVSGSSNDGFYIAQYGLPPGQRVYPLSWDQRHTVKGVLTVSLPWDLSMTMVGEWHSGRPYTRYPSATGFEKVEGGSFVQNNARMPDYTMVDVRAEKRFGLPLGTGASGAVYVECRNLLNTRNVLWLDSNGRVGGELDDPGGYSIGRRTSLGLLVQF
jgi:outer membrane receptor for ferrienterochelin and colicin